MSYISKPKDELAWDTEIKARERKDKKARQRLAKMRLRQTLMLNRERDTRIAYPTKVFAVKVKRAGETVKVRELSGTVMSMYLNR